MSLPISLGPDFVFGSRHDAVHDPPQFIGQLRMASQPGVDAAGQVGDAVGPGQTQPRGELMERDLTEPGGKGTSNVGITAASQGRPVQAAGAAHRLEDGFGSSGDIMPNSRRSSGRRGEFNHPIGVRLRCPRSFAPPGIPAARPGRVPVVAHRVMSREVGHNRSIRSFVSPPHRSEHYPHLFRSFTFC